MKPKTAGEIWEVARGELQLQLSKTNFNTWLRDATALSFNNGTFVIGVQSNFAAEWLQKRLLSLIKKSLINITGQNIEIRFEVHHGGIRYPGDVSVETPNSTNGIQPPLHSQYTFDSFIVGNSNRLAYAASLAVAEKPGQSFNPLFIYGKPGLGKTHLLQAIAHVQQVNKRQYMYLSSEQFTNAFINSIKGRRTEEFRDGFRHIDILLIDDIHFIAGKEQTQECFFHIFNELHNSNKQLVISSDRFPKSMPQLEERLRSRFEWGLLADIQPPDLETRIAILKVRAEQQKLSIEEDILEFIARKIKNNIRELEGVLNRISAVSRLDRNTLNQDNINSILCEFTTEKEPPKLSAGNIIDAVCTYYDIKPPDLTGKRRVSHLLNARYVATYILKNDAGITLSEIGKVLGGRDHSTVLHSLKKIESDLSNNMQLQQDITEIKKRLSQ